MCVARARAVGLAEAIEHVRQELGRDAFAGVRDATRCASSAGALERDVDAPPAGVNFTAFDRMFRNTCCSRLDVAHHREIRRAARASPA